MFSNTGSLSLYLSLFFIAISLLGIFSIYLIIKNKSIENENIDKIIELGKWFIVSVAITLSASIVNDGFRERDQDIKEMDVFEKYVNTILEASGIEKRKLLCEYFASVSPEGPIQESWKKYQIIVDKHLAEIKEDEKKSADIVEKVIKGTASESDIAEKDHLDAKISVALTQSLAPPKDQDIQDIQEWVVIAGSDSDVKAASDEVKKVEGLKYPVGIYKKLNRYRTVVGPFLNKNEALVALPEIKKGVNVGSYLVNLQTWCNTHETKDGYFECKP